MTYNNTEEDNRTLRTEEQIQFTDEKYNQDEEDEQLSPLRNEEDSIGLYEQMFWLYTKVTEAHIDIQILCSELL